VARRRHSGRQSKDRWNKPMKNLHSLNALLPLGMAALGLWLALFQIVRGSVRTKKSSSSEGEQIRAMLQATRSALEELKTMLSSEAACPGLPEPSPIPE